MAANGNTHGARPKWRIGEQCRTETADIIVAVNEIAIGANDALCSAGSLDNSFIIQFFELVEKLRKHSRRWYVVTHAATLDKVLSAHVLTPAGAARR